jgi:transposase-like protein
MGMNVVAKIRQATRRKYTAEEKIRIVLEGSRGEIAISELCRREEIAPTMYYRWSKAFLDAGKNGLTLRGVRSPNCLPVDVNCSTNTGVVKAEIHRFDHVPCSFMEAESWTREEAKMENRAGLHSAPSSIGGWERNANE